MCNPHVLLCCSVARAREDTLMSLQNTEPTSLIQRFIDPEEIANAVAFISSDLASAMNGSSYRCEGGIVKHI